jgi:Dolichyl-phosphate-mannose-protein mannosyltransferase
MKKSDDLPSAFVVATFALAAVLRLVVLFGIRWQPSFDDAWYFRTAVDLASGRGYLNDQGNPSAYFPVGYPATMAAGMSLLGTSFKAAQFINVLFSLGTMACVYAIVRALSDGRKLATLAAALFGFLPNQIVSCVVTMSEITFTFVLTLGVLVALSRASERSRLMSLVVGLVFGWATLIRPQALLVPVIVIPAIAFVRHGGRHFVKAAIVRVALTMLALGAVVAPWTYRNYEVFHTFVLVSSNGGENLLIGNNPEATQHYTAPATFYPKGLDIWKLPELERDRIGGTLAKAYLRAHPLHAVLVSPKKIWYMYRSDLGVTNWIWEAYGESKTPLYYLAQGLTQAGYLAVLGAAFLWLALGLRKPLSDPGDRLLRVVLVAVGGYFTLVTMVFFGDARYHQPIMPLIAIAAAYFVAERSWRSKASAASP